MHHVGAGLSGFQACLWQGGPIKAAQLCEEKLCVQHSLSVAVQVKTLDFHPVQPWLAFADFAQVVTVWDWSTEQASECAASRALES